MKKLSRVSIFVLSIFALGFFAPLAKAAVTVTPVTNGTSLSADTASLGGTGIFTVLTGPIIREGAVGDIKSGRVTLTAPTGFEFDALHPATVTVTSSTTNATTNINHLSSGTVIIATTTASQILFIITSQSSSARNTLIWNNVRVRPTLATPLTNGNLLASSTGIIKDLVLPFAIGTLTEVDITPPVISVHNDVSADIIGASAVVSWTNPTATDQVDGNDAVFCTPASGASFIVGSTTVTCIASDTAGNHAASTTFSVIVRDVTPPPPPPPPPLVSPQPPPADSPQVAISTPPDTVVVAPPVAAVIGGEATSTLAETTVPPVSDSTSTTTVVAPTTVVSVETSVPLTVSPPDATTTQAVPVNSEALDTVVANSGADPVVSPPDTSLVDNGIVTDAHSADGPLTAADSNTPEDSPASSDATIPDMLPVEKTEGAEVGALEPSTDNSVILAVGSISIPVTAAPTATSQPAITALQLNSLALLLEAFGVDEETVDRVRSAPAM